MKDQKSRAPASVSNIYRLDGRVPVGKAIPFGLAMFVANVTPVMLIASVAVYNDQAFTAIDTGITQTQFYKQEHFADAECSCFSMSK